MAKLPIFTTERLILREVTETDAAAYEKNFVDYEIISQLASVIPWPYPAGGVLDFIRQPGKFVNASYTEREIWELTRARWREFKSQQT
jgi:hypothetical protein